MYVFRTTFIVNEYVSVITYVCWNNTVVLSLPYLFSLNLIRLKKTQSFLGYKLLTLKTLSVLLAAGFKPRTVLPWGNSTNWWLSYPFPKVFFFSIFLHNQDWTALPILACKYRCFKKSMKRQILQNWKLYIFNLQIQRTKESMKVFRKKMNFIAPRITTFIIHLTKYWVKAIFSPEIYICGNHTYTTE